jgi:hypothetical protein
MRQLKYCLFFFLVLFNGCAAQKAAPPEGPLTRAPETTPVQTPAEEIFDPAHISRELYDSTIHDVQSYIEELNRIISRRNYDAWKTNLSSEYFTEISSAANLKNISELPAMKSQRIVLKTPEDYFTYVVVPSRANSRVDDIEFSTQTRVKVYTINTKNERLRLYDLEHVGNTWKIIN